MVKSIMFCRAFLLVSIAQLAVSLSLSSQAAGVLTLTLSLAPLATLTAADVDDNADDTEASAVSASKECKESGTCNDGEDVNASTEENGTNSEQTQPAVTATHASNGDRLITKEEIALHTGGAAGIWLSILGKVFDVSTGTDFYDAQKGSYKFYAGRDASPCFSSGKNNQEGADEKMEEWEDIRLISMWEWSQFYAEHETYKYLGILAGSRYYDELGNESQVRQDIVRRSLGAKQTADEERIQKKRDRQAAREARKKK